MTTNLRNRTDHENTLTVGDQVFSIDRKLFALRSAVFRKAFEDADAQQSSEITLSFKSAQETHPTTFIHYKTLVETGEVHPVLVDPHSPVPVLSDLIIVYAFAWQLEDYTAANFFIDPIISEMTQDPCEPEPYNIAWIYASVKPAGDCPLRRLLVDLQVYDPRQMHQIPFTSYRGSRPGALIEYLQDVVQELELLIRAEGSGAAGETNDVSTFPRQKPTSRGPCHYHKHDEDHLECRARESMTKRQEKTAKR